MAIRLNVSSRVVRMNVEHVWSRHSFNPPLNIGREDSTDSQSCHLPAKERYGGSLPLVPVRSSEALPKELLLQVAARLREVVLEAPVTEHEMVIEDVFGTGVNIITSREMPCARETG